MFEPEQIAPSEPESAAPCVAPPAEPDGGKRAARPAIPEGSLPKTEERKVLAAAQPQPGEPEAPEPEAEAKAEGEAKPETVEPTASERATEASANSSWRSAVAGLAVGLLLAVIVTGVVLRLNRVSEPGLHEQPGAAATADAAEEAAESPGNLAE